MTADDGAPRGWWRRGLSILFARGGDTLLRVAIFPATALVLAGEDFSRYALLTAALATGQTLFALGAPRVAMFFHRRGERGPLFAWLLLLASAPCALAAALLSAWPSLRVFWFGSVPPRLFWIGLSPLPFLLLADSLSATLLAAGRERAYSFFLWGRTLAAGLVLVSSLAVAARLEWILWGRLGLNAAAAIGLALAAGARPRWSAVGGLAGPALRFGVPVAAAGLLMAVHRRADVFLLSALGRANQIGAYALAYALAESLWILTDSLEAGLFVDLSGRSPAVARQTAAAARRRFHLVALGAAAAILAGGETILLLFFGRRYPEAPALLPAVLAGTAAWGAARPSASWLYAAGRARTLAACHVGGLAVNLALCLAAIPRWGALGAAGASLVSYSLLALLVEAAFRAGE